MTDTTRTFDPGTGKPGRDALWLRYLLAFALAGALYVISVAPGALWQDNGMAQVRVLEHDYTGDLGLALAHPLFYLIAQAFQWLPFRESAYKTNLVSAVFGALTVANIYLLLNLLLAQSPVRRYAAAIGTLSLALAHTFWQHAALAEVYSVSTFVLSGEFLALVMYVRTQRPGWWLLLWFLNGLECANHVLALVTLGVIVIWSAFLFYSKQIRWTRIFPAIGLWVLGCLPYLVLGVQAWWAGDSLGSVLRSMLFGNFERQVLNVHLGFELLVTSLGVVALNFASPNILLIPAGIFTGRKFVLAGTFNFLLLATIFHFIFAVRYPVRDQYTFFIIPVLLLAIWLGLGAAWFLDRRSARWAIVLLLLTLTAPVGYFFLPRVVHRVAPKFAYPPIPYRDAPDFLIWPWKTGYHGADRLVNEVFAMAGPDAIILADGTSGRPFIYHQLAHGRRTDIIVAVDLYEELPTAERVQKLTRELQRREVFIVRPYPNYAPEWILKNFKIVPQGPVYRVQSLLN